MCVSSKNPEPHSLSLLGWDGVSSLLGNGESVKTEIHVLADFCM